MTSEHGSLAWWKLRGSIPRQGTAYRCTQTDRDRIFDPARYDVKQDVSCRDERD